MNNPYWAKQGHLNEDQAQLISSILLILCPKNIIEIGFATGRSASTILTNARPEKFISIDINFDYNDLGGREVLHSLLRDFSNFKAMEGPGQKILTQDFFTREFPYGIDFAFVDGGHSFTECFSDLKNVYAHVSSNFCILVDDYKSGPPKGCFLPEVKNAVDIFARNHKIKKLHWYKRGKGCAILCDEESGNKIKDIDGILKCTGLIKLNFMYQLRIIWQALLNSLVKNNRFFQYLRRL